MENRILPFDLLPERWQEDAFIAGGYPADSALASDLDLWVSVPPGNGLNVVREEILDHLTARGFIFEEQRDVTIDSDVRVPGEEDSYPLFLDNRKVAVVTARYHFKYKKPIHIIVTNGDVNEVLSGFDISTHQLAIANPFDQNGTFRIIKGEDWTPVEDEPVILKHTPHTQERFARIRMRYGVHRAKTA